MKRWKNYHKMKLIVQIKNSSNMSLNDQLTVVYNVAIWRTQPNKFPPKNVFNSSDKFLMSSLKNNFSSSFEGTNNSAHTKFLIIIWKKNNFCNYGKKNNFLYLRKKFQMLVSDAFNKCQSVIIFRLFLCPINLCFLSSEEFFYRLLPYYCFF